MAYKNLSDNLKSNGIPSDKISLESKTMKFPTPESMFDFIKTYPDFLEREGAKVPENYKPWLSSSMEIPPLAGGVGRKRALSKAIYPGDTATKLNPWPPEPPWYADARAEYANKFETA